VKTAISIPDDLYAEVERLAQRLKRSRSRVYADAVREYVARHDPEAVTEALNRVADEVAKQVDPAVGSAAARVLRQTEW
jgi:metal-responsive CopG/Arc/MetJ family transcriptional regulator